MSTDRSRPLPPEVLVSARQDSVHVDLGPSRSARVLTACVKCGHDPSAAIEASWELVLDKRVSSANTYMVNSGASRWRYAKERDEWCLLVRVAMRAQGKHHIAKPRRRRVTITRVYSGRCQEIDRDNLYAGCKALVDALVREGVAHDDAREWLELHVEQRRGETNESRVLVEELA